MIYGRNYCCVFLLHKSDDWRIESATDVRCKRVHKMKAQWRDRGPFVHPHFFPFFHIFFIFLLSWTTPPWRQCECLWSQFNWSSGSLSGLNRSPEAAVGIHRGALRGKGVLEFRPPSVLFTYLWWNRLDQILEIWCHFIKSIHRIKNLLNTEGITKCGTLFYCYHRP